MLQKREAKFMFAMFYVAKYERDNLLSLASDTRRGSLIMTDSLGLILLSVAKEFWI